MDKYCGQCGNPLGGGGHGSSKVAVRSMRLERDGESYPMMVMTAEPPELIDVTSGGLFGAASVQRETILTGGRILLEGHLDNPPIPPNVLEDPDRKRWSSYARPGDVIVIGSDRLTIQGDGSVLQVMV